ncbi:MAG: hypothetical protein C4547_14950 [Phycisphaerales bacterium]|nr:MAG: hypothetical protein C4547_14950 [Phycisphaerales bacterium]
MDQQSATDVAAGAAARPESWQMPAGVAVDRQFFSFNIICYMDLRRCMILSRMHGGDCREGRLRGGTSGPFRFVNRLGGFVSFDADGG